MSQKWKKILVRIMVWMSAEIVLNLLNLDTLSDYSEFLLERQISCNCPKIMLCRDFEIADPIALKPFKPQLRFHRFTIASV